MEPRCVVSSVSDGSWRIPRTKTKRPKRVARPALRVVPHCWSAGDSQPTADSLPTTSRREFAAAPSPACAVRGMLKSPATRPNAILYPIPRRSLKVLSMVPEWDTASKAF